MTAEKEILIRVKVGQEFGQKAHRLVSISIGGDTAVVYVDSLNEAVVRYLDGKEKQESSDAQKK